jgi:hypothetical protein
MILVKIDFIKLPYFFMLFVLYAIPLFYSDSGLKKFC